MVAWDAMVQWTWFTDMTWKFLVTSVVKPQWDILEDYNSRKRNQLCQLKKYKDNWVLHLNLLKRKNEKKKWKLVFTNVCNWGYPEICFVHPPGTKKKKKKVIRARFDNAPRWVLIGFTSSAQAVTITKNKAGRSTLLSSLGALVSWY